MRLRVLCVAVAALAACQQSAEAQNEAGRTAGQSAEQGERVGQPTPPTSTGERALQLEPMTIDDFGTLVPAGIGCSFFVAGMEGMAFIASSPDDPAARSPAAVKIGGQTVGLSSVDPGEIDALFAGGRFTGDGIEALVTPRGEGRPDGTETTVHDATLTITRGDDRETWDGEWFCGA